MIFNVLTIFPAMFPGPLGCSVTGTALLKDLWTLNVFDIRSYADKNHENAKASVDDRPYGGGPGMVLRADVLGRCVDDVLAAHPGTKLVYTSPRGAKFNQDIARQTIDFDNITLLCGRFEGIDERVVSYYNFSELSIGDYVLTGGELAAMVVIDSCVRLLPGVVGNAESLEYESMSGGLEYPHYTRPATWRSLSVPDVLLSGHHGEIEQWRREAAKEITKQRRPDLFRET
ncbi:tRNA (guanine-N(1)-)-methyltransferase [Anaplasma platys]|uniref:tRNA (guanine-N(1)-)-methyltransferase n=1 Tax=Anaplasma platys TaxID=949 RepID=A0A858PX23_9RICK|nr:tRNA (guanosine(37)-N1)-methyltransferase TrmD [Anaplasma platys]QJC27135.1 tRNA (guanine-N(1)-)-methyltransferase [Anaplasma platys]